MSINSGFDGVRRGIEDWNGNRSTSTLGEQQDICMILFEGEVITHTWTSK